MAILHGGAAANGASAESAAVPRWRPAVICRPDRPTVSQTERERQREDEVTDPTLHRDRFHDDAPKRPRVLRGRRREQDDPVDDDPADLGLQRKTLTSTSTFKSSF